MIITRLTGGLGNQMFQYAAGLALANRRQTVLKLDIRWFVYRADHEDHDRYSLDCFNIGSHFASYLECDYRIETSLYKKMLRRLRGREDRRRGGFHQAKAFSPYPEFFDLPDDTYISGNWQSEGFFRGVEPQLRRHFTMRYPMLHSAALMAADIEQNPASVAVHIRRGDYVQGTLNPQCRPLELKYYQEAEAHIRSIYPEATLYVFSDDIDIVSQEYRPTGPHIFVRAGADWAAHDEMQLMSACKHFIIANSTFSWWAAWLGCASSKVVIAPEPWFANSTHDGSSVVPVDWKRIKTSHISG